MEFIKLGLIRLIAAIDIGDPNIPKATADSSAVEVILKIVLGIAGGISVIMVAIGAFKYVLSLGEVQAVAKAKDTILYAIIGLIVTIIAFALVNAVMGKL